MITEPMKQELLRLGFVPIKAYTGNGRPIGTRIYKDGQPVHRTPAASAEFARNLIAEHGGTLQEPAQ